MIFLSPKQIRRQAKADMQLYVDYLEMAYENAVQHIKHLEQLIKKQTKEKENMSRYRKPIWACGCDKTKKVKMTDVSPPLCPKCLTQMFASYQDQPTKRAG